MGFVDESLSVELPRNLILRGCICQGTGAVLGELIGIQRVYFAREEEPPVRRSIQDGSISLELGGGVGMVRKLAEDGEGAHLV